MIGEMRPQQAKHKTAIAPEDQNKAKASHHAGAIHTGVEFKVSLPIDDVDRLDALQQRKVAQKEKALCGTE